MLRSPWKFATFGLVGFAFISAALEAGRACGLVEFWLERLPGALLGLSSSPGAWACYFGFGALLGLAYHPIFFWLGRADWRTGIPVGVLQWLVFGLITGLLETHITHRFTVLPTLPPQSSFAGLIVGVFILLLNCFFGAFMGSLARLSPKAPEQAAERAASAQIKGTPESPRREAA